MNLPVLNWGVDENYNGEGNDNSIMTTLNDNIAVTS